MVRSGMMMRFALRETLHTHTHIHTHTHTHTHTDDPDEDGDDAEIEVEELVYKGKTFNVSLAYSPLHKDTDSVIWGQVSAIKCFAGRHFECFSRCPQPHLC